MRLAPDLHAFLWRSSQHNNCNTYLLSSGGKHILIDPGHAALFDHVRQGLGDTGLTPDDIDLVICTHAHPDHIEAVRFFSASRFALHTAEWELIRTMAPYLKNAMGIDADRFQPDFFLTEGELKVGEISLQVYHTPGHSPGGITLHWPREGAMFTGDLIFKGGLGRTDLPGGDGGRLKDSIRRIAAIPADWLLSGHGEVISGKDAVADNFKAVESAWFGYV